MHKSLLLAALLLATLPAIAAEKVVAIHAISAAGVGKIIGVITFTDSADGLIIKPDIGELTPGPHGFHIHDKPNCAEGEKDGKMQAGLAAGGHYDPNKTGKHEGPAGQGHQGDLPVLEVAADNGAEKPLFAPHLKLADIIGRSIMIHEGADNYSDTPKPLGGGGARIACGVVE